MNVEQLFERLSYDELSNLALGVEGSGAIEERHQPKIVRLANNGLLRLYTRFVLCEKDVLIEQVEGITNYHLIPKFAESNWDENDENAVPHPYIKDLPEEPFTGDVIKILNVFDSLGRKLPLNDDNADYSLYTPQNKVLQVPQVTPGVSLSVHYQAMHPQLDPKRLDQELELPEVLEPALTAFIAWRVYSGMNTQEATMKAQEHHGNYETICTDSVVTDALSTSLSSTNIKFHQRGWR